MLSKRICCRCIELTWCKVSCSKMLLGLGIIISLSAKTRGASKNSSLRDSIPRRLIPIKVSSTWIRNLVFSFSNWHLSRAFWTMCLVNHCLDYMDSCLRVGFRQSRRFISNMVICINKTISKSISELKTSATIYMINTLLGCVPVRRTTFFQTATDDITKGTPNHLLFWKRLWTQMYGN